MDGFGESVSCSYWTALLFEFYGCIKLGGGIYVIHVFFWKGTVMAYNDLMILKKAREVLSFFKPLNCLKEEEIWRGNCQPMVFGRCRVYLLGENCYAFSSGKRRRLKPAFPQNWSFIYVSLFLFIYGHFYGAHHCSIWTLTIKRSFLWANTHIFLGSPFISR